MPLSRRLADLEETLDLLYDTLGNVQKRLACANDIFEQDSIKKRMHNELLPSIREREAEYWQLLAQEANSLGIDEVDANNAVVEVVQLIETVQQNSTNQYPEQVIQLLTEILSKLNEPEKPAAAKLKAAIPLLPPLSYEMELDTGALLRSMFSTFSRLIKGAKKEKPNYGQPKTVPLRTQRQARLQQQVQALQTIIDDATSNQNFANARERFLMWRKETTNFLSKAVGKQEAITLAMIAPRGDIKFDKARLLNEAVKIRDYLVTLSQKLE